MLELGATAAACPPAAKRAEDSTRRCWVCLKCGDSDLLQDELLHGGCACRGSAGFAHTECLVPAAQANRERWTRCPTCKQRWTGVTKLLMARARWGTHIAADTAGGDPERLAAALELVQALGESGELDEAAQRGAEALAMARRLHGDDHPAALWAMGTLAQVNVARGDHAAALPLRAAVLEQAVRAHGPDHPDSLLALANLGSSHMQLGELDAALPLMTEAVEGYERTVGSDDPDTLVATGNLAGLYVRMGKDELALPLRIRSLEAQRRVLGQHHPHTLVAAGNLGCLLSATGDHVSAAGLLEEATEGLSVVCGAEHPHTVSFRESRSENALRHAVATLRQVKAP